MDLALTLQRIYDSEINVSIYVAVGWRNPIRVRLLHGLGTGRNSARLCEGDSLRRAQNPATRTGPMA